MSQHHKNHHQEQRYTTLTSPKGNNTHQEIMRTTQRKRKYRYRPTRRPCTYKNNSNIRKNMDSIKGRHEIFKNPQIKVAKKHVFEIS